MYTYFRALAQPVFGHIFLPPAEEQDLPLKSRLVWRPIANKDTEIINVRQNRI